jgi:inorganic pyrophosphatase
MPDTNVPKARHRINDVPYKTPDGLYQMVVEIPSGTNEKWQTDPITGDFYHDTIDGVPRIINFLPYPFNYGIVPQTVLAKEKGGDGDPTDIITLAPACPRGSIMPVRIIGAIRLSERGETDTKVIAILPEGPFRDVSEIAELLMRYPGTVEIIRLWFEGYKGPGSFLFQGYADSREAMDFVEESHQDWRACQQLLPQ